MNEGELLYREMNEEDPWYMGDHDEEDEDNEEHIAVIVCKRAKPIEYIK